MSQTPDNEPQAGSEAVDFNSLGFEYSEVEDFNFADLGYGDSLNFNDLMGNPQTKGNEFPLDPSLTYGELADNETGTAAQAEAFAPDNDAAAANSSIFETSHNETSAAVLTGTSPPNNNHAAAAELPNEEVAHNETSPAISPQHSSDNNETAAGDLSFSEFLHNETSTASGTSPPDVNDAGAAHAAPNDVEPAALADDASRESSEDLYGRSPEGETARHKQPPPPVAGLGFSLLLPIPSDSSPSDLPNSGVGNPVSRPVLNQPPQAARKPLFDFDNDPYGTGLEGVIGQGQGDKPLVPYLNFTQSPMNLPIPAQVNQNPGPYYNSNSSYGQGNQGYSSQKLGNQPIPGQVNRNSGPYYNSNSSYGHGNQGYGNPNHGNLNRGNLNHGTPNYGTPNYGTPNYGTPNYGTPNHGNQNHGNQNHGNQNHGNQNYGNQNHSNQDYGNRNYGTPNYGIPNYGTPNYGNQNYGNQNYGHNPNGTPLDGSLGFAHLGNLDRHQDVVNQPEAGNGGVLPQHNQSPHQGLAAADDPSDESDTMQKGIARALTLQKRRRERRANANAARAPPEAAATSRSRKKLPLTPYPPIPQNWQLPAWGPADKPDLFRYPEYQAAYQPIGGLARLRGRLYTQQELAYYFEHNPRELRLWVQWCPAQSNHRSHDTQRKCRWANCPKKTKLMDAGWFRVAFDEFPGETSNAQRDPYHMAGGMHLWCFEQCFDLVAMLRRGNQFLLQADTRVFTNEVSNNMAITRDHVQKPERFMNVYNEWFRNHSNDDYPPPGAQWVPRAHDQSLSRALVGCHLHWQVDVRATTRENRREKHEHQKKAGVSKDMDYHMGDLGKTCEAARAASRERAMLKARGTPASGGQEDSEPHGSGTDFPPAAEAQPRSNNPMFQAGASTAAAPDNAALDEYGQRVRDFLWSPSPAHAPGADETVSNTLNSPSTLLQEEGVLSVPAAAEPAAEPSPTRPSLKRKLDDRPDFDALEDLTGTISPRRKRPRGPSPS